MDLRIRARRFRNAVLRTPAWIERHFDLILPAGEAGLADSGGCSPVLDGNPLTGTDEYVIRVLIRQAKPQHHLDRAGNVRPNLNIDLTRPDDRWSNVDREFGRQRSCSSGQNDEPREAGKMRSIDHGSFTLEIRDQMSARAAV